MTNEARRSWVPITPGGTVCSWLAADTEDQAWENLLKDAAHMPYKDKAGFIARGYEVGSLPWGIFKHEQLRIKRGG